MADCVFWGGVGRGTTLRPPPQKPIIRQLLIVICSSSIVSDESPAPPLQESPHCNKDAGGGVNWDSFPPPTWLPPPPPTPPPGMAPPFPPPRTVPVVLSHGGLLHGQWLMTPDAAQSLPCLGAPSSLSEGALAGAAWDLAAYLAVGSARGRRRAAESGAGAETQVSGRGCRRHRAGWNTPASSPARCWESRTRTCAGRRHGYITEPNMETCKQYCHCLVLMFTLLSLSLHGKHG